MPPDIDPLRLPVVFALPEGSDAPSGGNVYNRELTRALRELTPPLVTSVADAERRYRRGAPGLYCFDTLDLERLETLPRRASEQLVALVVHHLPSLEPDLLPGHPALVAEARALGAVDLFVVTSEWTRELLVSRGHPRDAMLTVPPGVPVSPARARRYEPPLRALVAANLVPRKDVLSLFAELAELDHASPNYVLRVVGRRDIDPAYTEACERRLASRPALERKIELAGPKEYERMGEVYETSDLVVSSARMETFGMALAEARAAGVPILARDAGNAREHVTDGENGRLFSSAGELAHELVRLAMNERSMAELFERAQRVRGAEYGWKAAAERFRRELERAHVKALSRSPARNR